MKHPTTFGKGIKNARMETGYSQRQLAKRSGVNQATISRAERGDTNITMGTAMRLTKALGLRIQVRLA